MVNNPATVFLHANRESVEQQSTKNEPGLREKPQANANSPFPNSRDQKSARYFGRYLVPSIRTFFRLLLRQPPLFFQHDLFRVPPRHALFTNNCSPRIGSMNAECGHRHQHPLLEVKSKTCTLYPHSPYAGFMHYFEGFLQQKHDASLSENLSEAIRALVHDTKQRTVLLSSTRGLGKSCLLNAMLETTSISAYLNSRKQASASQPYNSNLTYHFSTHQVSVSSQHGKYSTVSLLSHVGHATSEQPSGTIQKHAHTEHQHCCTAFEQRRLFIQQYSQHSLYAVPICRRQTLQHKHNVFVWFKRASIPARTSTHHTATVSKHSIHASYDVSVQCWQCTVFPSESSQRVPGLSCLFLLRVVCVRIR